MVKKLARVGVSLAFVGFGLGLGLSTAGSASAAPKASVAPAKLTNSTWTFYYCWTSTTYCGTFTAKLKKKGKLTPTTGLKPKWSISKSATYGVTAFEIQFPNASYYPCHANYNGYLSSTQSEMVGLQQTDDYRTACLGDGDWIAFKDAPSHAPSSPSASSKFAGVR